MKIIVDGSNVLRYGNECNVLHVEAMLASLEAKGYEWFCFFDANCIYLVTGNCPQSDVDLFVGILNKFKEKICIIPGGTQADDYILQKADRENACIVSNDRYRKYAARYPWVLPVRKDDHTVRRVYPFLYAENRLQIADLDVFWDMVDEREVRSTVRSGLSDLQLKSAIERINSGSSSDAKSAQEKTSGNVIVPFATRDTSKFWHAPTDCKLTPSGIPVFDTSECDGSEVSRPSDMFASSASQETLTWLKVLGIGCAFVAGVAAIKFAKDAYDS